MAFTEFCCRAGGSNLNAGTRNGDSTEPGVNPVFIYPSGTWATGSPGIFTPASGNPQADGVVVGDFASVYIDGATVTGYVGQVTAVSSTTITVSGSIKFGTQPTSGTLNRTLRIGGAWAGPGGTSGFPLTTPTPPITSLTNLATNRPRVNFKSDQTYAISAGMTLSYGGPLVVQGYTTTYGDGGRAILDGGTTGAAYTLLGMDNSELRLESFILQNNGATGTAYMAAIREAVNCVFRDCREHGLRLNTGCIAIGCEAYNACQGTTNAGGFHANGQCSLIRCIAHHNAGSGLYCSSNIHVIGHSCIFAQNAQYGANFSSGGCLLTNCDFYANALSGLRGDNMGNYTLQADNCNFIKNSGYGITTSSSSPQINITTRFCGFGSGTQANTSGKYPAYPWAGYTTGEITYPADVVPWVDPVNGDFRINLAAAKGAGYGQYTQVQPGYAGTISYPDIGAAQHLESGGSVIVVEDD